MLAAAARPISLRRANFGPAPSTFALVAAANGLALTLTAAVALALARALSGPSVWHGSGAVEAILFAAVGAGWGCRVAARQRAGVISLLL